MRPLLRQPQSEGAVRVVVLALLLLLILARALFPEHLVLDSISVVLILVAVTLTLAPLLSVAKLPGGTEFRFRTKVEAGEQISADVQARLYREGFTGSPQDWPPFIEVSDEIRELALERPADAVAGLRWALIEGMRSSAQDLASERMPPREPLELLAWIGKARGVWPEQAALMRVLWDLSTSVPLQGEVAPSDALRMIALADVLNDSFPLGYSINFSPNEEWEEAGLICEYQHCIENMPLPGGTRAEHIASREGIRARLEEGFFDDLPERKLEFETMLASPVPDDLPDEVDRSGSCPVFGHFCPGGQAKVDVCGAAQEALAEPGV